MAVPIYQEVSTCLPWLAAKSIFWRCISYGTFLDFPASHVIFWWTNSIKWKLSPTPCCWIVPILLDVLGCHRVVHKNLQIRLGHVVRVTSERDTWSMSDMKQATDDRRNCDHIILSWFCHFAVQNPKLTSRFCCVFQRVNSCTPPSKLTFPPKTENWWLENEMFF